MVIVICPGSIFEISSSVGAPSARARSDGCHDAMKGIAANPAPTAPVAIVARVRNLRRSRSTSSPATSTLSAIEPLSRCRLPTHRLPQAHRLPRERPVRAVQFLSLREAAHYTHKEHYLPCAHRLPAGSRGSLESADAGARRVRIHVRGRISCRGACPRLSRGG